MNNGINLISGKKQSIEKQANVVRLFRRIAYGSLLAVGSIAVILFLLNFFSPLSKLTSQQQATADSLMTQKSKIVKLLLLRDRIKNIDQIFLQNSSLETMLTSLTLHTPGDAAIDTLGISKEGVSIIMTSPSLVSINSFMDYLNDQVTKKLLFKKVTITSLALDVKNGKYTLSVSAIPL